MATKNIPQGSFSATEAAVVRHNVGAARAVLRTVVLAFRAMDEGSILSNGQTGAERWSPAVGEACQRLQAVRGVLTESAGAPSVDWFTPLALADALDAALWHKATARLGEGLDNDEAASAAQVVVDVLDTLLRQVNAVAFSDAAASLSPSPAL